MKSASSRSGKPRALKRTLSRGRRKVPEFDDEHPELTEAQIARGIVRRGLKPIPPKIAISLRVDQDVLDWFRAQGEGYQTRMNAVLRAFRDASL